MLFKKTKPVYEKRLEKYWDDHMAADSYRLVKYEIVNGKLQDGFYWLGGGDKEWAKKEAKHHGLPITDPINEED